MTAPSLSWAIEALIASALLMALVLAIRGPVRRAFGAPVAYALWALPALRLALPPLPADWRQAVATPIADMGAQVSVFIVPVAGTASAVPEGPSLGVLMAGLWVSGAAAFLAWHLVAYDRFCRRMLARAETVDRIGGVTVVSTDAAAGPLAFGIARRFVAFPPDFAARYDDGERALALAHELGHHQRGDLIANWIGLAVLALHWFNPLAWFAFRAFRADQEMANDARVLAACGAVERYTYACAIVKSAHGGTIAAACHLHTINDLKGRLKMLGIHRASRSRLAIGSVAVASMTVLGLGVTASGTQAAETVRAGVERATGVDIAALAPVTAVAAPAPTAAPVARERRVMIVKDGKTRVYEGADADAYVAANPVPVPPVPPVPPAPGVAPRPPLPPLPPQAINVDVPEIASRDCGRGEGGGEKQTVIHREKAGKRMMIICTNRIETMAAESAKIAANSREIARHALEGALTSLRSARAGIVADRSIDEAARRDALADIDEGIAEVQSEMADPD